METPATYLTWNFVLISVPNVLVILGMIAVFLAALLAPFPGHHDADSEDGRDA